MRKPLITLDRFIRSHRKNDRMLKEYLLSKKGKKLFDAGVFDELKNRASLSLPAINRRARIALARAAYIRGKELFQQNGKPAYLVTVTPRQFANLLSDAAEFDPQTIIQWTKRRLGDWHFVGVVEAALFTNVAQYLGAEEPAVSWHVHLVVWGCKECEVAALVDDVNARVKSFVPGRDTAHCEKLKPTQVPGRFLYILKMPLSDYRIWPAKKDRHAVSGRTQPQFNIQKRPLRPGDGVRMCKVLRRLRLPELIFAGGDGAAFKRQIEEDARRSIERHDDRNERILRDLLAVGA